MRGGVTVRTLWLLSGTSKAAPRPRPLARLLSGSPLPLVRASVRMGFLNTLEGPHSFIPKLQRQMGKPSSSQLPPHPGLGAQGPGLSDVQPWPECGLCGREGAALSAPSSELQKPFGKVRPKGQAAQGSAPKPGDCPTRHAETAQSHHHDLREVIHHHHHAHLASMRNWGSKEIKDTVPTLGNIHPSGVADAMLTEGTLLRQWLGVKVGTARGRV